MSLEFEPYQVPLNADNPALSSPEVELELHNLNRSWEVVEGKKLRLMTAFSSFKDAMVFVVKVAKLADSEGHHPDIMISYTQVMIELYTHTVGALTVKDFIMARKIEQLL